MWSFVIYDRLRYILFCSRDRFGKKPFFYTHQKNFFAFCSEIKGLIPVMGKLRPNYKVLTHFIVLNQTDNTDASFFDNILKLPAGHNAVINLVEGSLDIYPFYILTEKKNLVEKSLEEVVSSFQSDFNRSVMLRLRSDVTVGTCLSGGLDSSYLAAVASEKYFGNTGKRFKAVTAGSIDKEWDESNYAEMAARHLGLDWIHTMPDAQMFKQEFEHVVYCQEEPFHTLSVFMQYFVMKSCREAGITVLLNGQGADEVLMGYFQHVTTYLKRLPFLERMEAARKITKNFGVSPWYLFKLYHYFNNSNLRIKRQLSRWRDLKADMRSTYLDFDHVEKAAKLVNGSLFDSQAFEISSNILPMLLRYEDKNSMAFSIESRLPYLDYQLIENFLNTPERFRIFDGWSKYVLRKAMENQLPKEIVWRKKKFGFMAPTKLWLADESYFSSMISDSKILKRMLNKVEYPEHDLNLAWRMISVAAWERKFGVSD
jgi:asparagine synthase (glutamine-hydrolysing)